MIFPSQICHVDSHRFAVVVSTQLRNDPYYMQVYITWMYLAVMYLLPFLCLLIFNAFIYNQVRLL